MENNTGDHDEPHKLLVKLRRLLQYAEVRYAKGDFETGYTLRTLTSEEHTMTHTYRPCIKVCH
jgi:hypothetical protein